MSSTRFPSAWAIASGAGKSAACRRQSPRSPKSNRCTRTCPVGAPQRSDLNEFDPIPVCVGYRIGGREVCGMPPTVAEIAKIEPVYENVPGWSTSTFGIAKYDDLPAKAKEYIAFLEARTGVEVGCISTGPERNQTIVRPGSRFAKLVG